MKNIITNQLIADLCNKAVCRVTVDMHQQLPGTLFAPICLMKLINKT